LEQLKVSANVRKAKSLDILNSVCREQFERSGKDFSIGLIGRLSEEKGGPATQSIRNKTGNDFKALISAWANHTGGSVKRQPKQNDNPLYAILEKIPDPAVRAVVGIVLAENKKLKGEVQLLKRNSGIIIDLRPVEFVPMKDSEVQVLPALTGLTASEIEALKFSVCEKFLQNEGWNSVASGRILNDKGRVLFKTGFLSAFKKMLSMLQEEGK
jgi:hypothetical protein